MPPETAIKLELSKEAADDPTRTLEFLKKTSPLRGVYFGLSMAHLLLIEGRRRDHLAHPATLDIVQVRRDHEFGRDEV